jgi:hypothetical protein
MRWSKRLSGPRNIPSGTGSFGSFGIRLTFAQDDKFDRPTTAQAGSEAWNPQLQPRFPLQHFPYVVAAFRRNNVLHLGFPQ